MKKTAISFVGMALFAMSLIPFSSTSQVTTGYYTAKEKCPISDGYQERCRPDGESCNVSSQTSCPEFEEIG